jgi:phosphoglycolate phosphatase-like HAD superfamily hydrolase
MPPALLLFDIDGTLVHSAGAGRRALERALEARCGRRGSLDGMQLDGMTDRLIVKEACQILGSPYNVALCDEVLSQYVSNLTEEIRTPNYRVLPGVAALLETLQARQDGPLLALGTGNVVGGARIKLARGGVDRFFDWELGGFGGDGELREEILGAALERARKRLGNGLRGDQVLVIGDTPRDVEAAKALGLRVMAVATGRHGLETLRGCAPDDLLETLEPAVAMPRILG